MRCARLQSVPSLVWQQVHISSLCPYLDSPLPPSPSALSLRLYNTELLELSASTSFLLLVPAADQVCSIRQTEESTAPNDCLRLPVQIFEMVHMMTYQRPFVSRYSRISSILETDTIMAQHAHREVSHRSHRGHRGG